MNELEYFEDKVDVWINNHIKTRGMYEEIHTKKKKIQKKDINA